MSKFFDGHVLVIPVTLPAPPVCDWDGCSDRRERGFVYCAEHIGTEYDRWLADADNW